MNIHDIEEFIFEVFTAEVPAWHGGDKVMCLKKLLSLEDELLKFPWGHSLISRTKWKAKKKGFLVVDTNSVKSLRTRFVQHNLDQPESGPRRGNFPFYTGPKPLKIWSFWLQTSAFIDHAVENLGRPLTWLVGCSCGWICVWSIAPYQNDYKRVAFEVIVYLWH